jgi:hypothetical protein
MQGKKSSPKSGEVVDSRADLLGQRAAFKTKLLHFAGEGTDQSCKWKITQLLASEITALTILQTFLTSQFQLNWWKEQNTTHSDHVRASS